jgi:hypothetical protein
MARVSGFRGTWQPNKRPYVTLTPDVYVALQGETSVIACGECQRKININDYVTGISTEASVDSLPGSATINLSIPDNDINNFYVDGQLVIISMMEVEIYAKGYYLVGGVPQYYRIFWGLIQTVTKDWSAGSTTVTLSCKDILRWWELTNATINPSFLELAATGSGSYNLWQNQFAGLNPITTIIQLARESMGDFESNNGAIGGLGYLPEKGAESPVIGSYAQDIMIYWQLKFANIWNNLRIYGTSGRSYQFTTSDGTASPVKLAASIIQSEQNLNSYDTLITHPEETTVSKKELDKAGTVEFTQNEIQNKLSVAMQARDQAGWEFFCDPSGDIVFKPPFYNLNVIPNKPVSWINDFEIIDDSITETEAEVYTHVISQGIAFGGVGFDAGLTDEVTAPRTGVFDFHLLRRYGFRRTDYPTEWAYDPRKLFFHLMDYLDRINARRNNGTITIPMRPELRIGFPVWVPYYDAFFYIQGLSHQFSVGGQATTTLTLIAKRSKYIAPSNIGTIKAGPITQQTINTNNTSAGPNAKKTIATKTYAVQFPDNVGASAGIITTQGNSPTGTPIPIRDPKSGKLLGYPNVVMVFKSFLGADSFKKILQAQGSSTANAPMTKVQAQNKSTGNELGKTNAVQQTLAYLKGASKYQKIQRASSNRYGAAMTNAGVYDYAHDTTGDFIELNILPATSFRIPGFDPTSNDPIIDALNAAQGNTTQNSMQNAQQLNDQITDAQQAVKTAQTLVNTTSAKVTQFQKQKSQANASNSVTTTGNSNNTSSAGYLGSTAASAGSNVSSAATTAGTNAAAASDALIQAQTDAANAVKSLAAAQQNLANLQAGIGSLKKLPTLGIIVRPVSDEFGFEVIGHYRYGRGAYIDRGQIRIGMGPNASTAGPEVNQISTQFAATAGVLTDPSTVQSGSGSYYNFAAQFDQMQPEDWMTGASFRGVAASGTTTDNPTSGIVLTDANTYSSNVKKNTGHSVFIEADQIHNSVTLAELGPSADIKGLQGFAMDCPCGLERANWLSILPSEFIQAVLSNSGSAQLVTSFFSTPTGTSTTSNATINDTLGNNAGDGFSTVQTTTQAITGTVTPASFFTVLEQYLSSQFDAQYVSNAQRELQDTGQSQGVVTQLFNADVQNNILGDSTDNPLFGPASLGDPSALQALQNQVNFGFGQTQTALENFKSAFQNGQQQINQDLAQAAPGGPLISATASSGSGATTLIDASVGITTQSTPPTIPTGGLGSGIGNVKITTPTPQVQPVTVIPVPNLKQVILNPSTNTQLENEQVQSIPGTYLQGGSPGQTTYPPPTKTGQH